MEYLFSELEPCTESEITVFAQTESGMGEPIVKKFATDPVNDTGIKLDNFKLKKIWHILKQ